MSTTLFLGDSHCSTSFVINAIDMAKELGIDRVFQVGDFGWFPKSNNGQAFIKNVAEYTKKRNMSLYWIPGNHEDWNDVQRIWNTNPIDHIRYQKSNMFLVRNGSSWQWDNLKFGTLAGAFSIDRDRRAKDWDWFEAEMPDESLIPGIGIVDVLITHEAPVVPPQIYASGQFRRVTESAVSQDTIYHAMMSTKPQLLIHGHWHHFAQYQVAGTTVQALDCNFTSLPYASCVLDSETKKLYTLNEFMYGGEGMQLA